MQVITLFGLRHVCSYHENPCVPRTPNSHPPKYRAFQVSFVGQGGQGKLEIGNNDTGTWFLQCIDTRGYIFYIFLSKYDIDVYKVIRKKKN